MLQLETELKDQLVEEEVEVEEDQDLKEQLKPRKNKLQFNQPQLLDLIYCLLS
jgi:hypothetical protein